MFCINCGSKLIQDSIFCNKCGFKVEDELELPPQNDSKVLQNHANISKTGTNDGNSHYLLGLIILIISWPLILFFLTLIVTDPKPFESPADIISAVLVTSVIGFLHVLGSNFLFGGKYIRNMLNKSSLIFTVCMFVGFYIFVYTVSGRR